MCGRDPVLGQPAKVHCSYNERSVRHDEMKKVLDAHRRMPGKYKKHKDKIEIPRKNTTQGYPLLAFQ